MKDINSGAQVLVGKFKNGGYEWPCRAPDPAFVSPSLLSSQISVPLSLCHSRLGHPAIPILKTLVSNSILSVSNKSTSFHYQDCSINKSHKIPFSTSSMSSSKPLQLVFSDVWTSPVHSVVGYKYYVIFVDHYMHRVWFYPLLTKSDVRDTFIRWKALVENRLQHRLITFHSDNGGEYLVLANYLSQNGVTHLISPPHTPQHNGFSERIHRHIAYRACSPLSCFDSSHELELCSSFCCLPD